MENNKFKEKIKNQKIINTDFPSSITKKIIHSFKKNFLENLSKFHIHGIISSPQGNKEILDNFNKTMYSK